MERRRQTQPLFQPNAERQGMTPGTFSDNRIASGARSEDHGQRESQWVYSEYVDSVEKMTTKQLEENIEKFLSKSAGDISSSDVGRTMIMLNAWNRKTHGSDDVWANPQDAQRWTHHHGGDGSGPAVSPKDPPVIQAAAARLQQQFNIDPSQFSNNAMLASGEAFRPSNSLYNDLIHTPPERRASLLSSFNALRSVAGLDALPINLEGLEQDAQHQRQAPQRLEAMRSAPPVDTTRMHPGFGPSTPTPGAELRSRY